MLPELEARTNVRSGGIGLGSLRRIAAILAGVHNHMNGTPDLPVCSVVP